MRNGKLQYLVKWLGYGDEENSWEPADALVTAAGAVRDFYKKNPGAPRPVAEVAKQLHLRSLNYITEFPKPLPKRDW